MEAIKQIRKRRGQNDESGPLDSSNAGQFDIRLENETKDAQQRQKDGGWVYDRKHKGASDGGRQKSYNHAKKAYEQAQHRNFIRGKIEALTLIIKCIERRGEDSSPERVELEQLQKSHGIEAQVH